MLKSTAETKISWKIETIFFSALTFNETVQSLRIEIALEYPQIILEYPQIILEYPLIT